MNRKPVFCDCRAKCVLSPPHSNLHVEALGKNMIVLSDVVSVRVILACVQITLLPELTLQI